MAFTKNQRNILKRANSRLSNIMEKAAGAEPALYYAPAVQDALTDLQGETKFRAENLKAAKSFLRKKTSTVAGARTWAAEMGLQPVPPAKPDAMTATEKREIDTANKRLAAMRKRGDEIPERYKNIDRFRKDTAALAHEFLQNPKTLKKPRKVYKQLPAKLGERVKKLADAYKNMLTREEYYRAKEAGEIPEELSYDEFAHNYQPPEFTGLDIARWARINGPHAYDDINQMTGRGASNVGDYWKIIEGFNFK